MKNNAVFFYIMIILSTLSACSEKDWLEIQVKDSDIKASFPQTPTQKVQKLTLPGMGEVTAVIVELRSKDISYTVSAVGDLNYDFNPRDINIGPHSFIKRGAILYETNDVYLGTMQGKEYLLRLKAKKIIQRIFIDKKRFYTMVTIFNSTHSLEAERFINSVRI